MFFSAIASVRTRSVAWATAFAALFAFVVMATAPVARAGDVIVTKYAMLDKTHGTEVHTGYADCDLPVDFVVTATHDCSCGAPNLVAHWNFGDGATANGWSVSHTYGTAGAGDHFAYVYVRCNTCMNGYYAFLHAYVYSGIEITRIGDIDSPSTTRKGRMCFNNEERVAGHALPVPTHTVPTLVDWRVYFPETNVTLLAHDTEAGSLPMLQYGEWPSTNTAWGNDPNGIAAFMDAYDQEGELNLTGPASEIAVFAGLDKFYESDGDQNPATGEDQNFYYYYSQTSATFGTHAWQTNFEGAPIRGITLSETGFPCKLGPLANDAGYGISRIGANHDESLSYIDDFAWTVRHEWRHHEQLTAWWDRPGITIVDTDHDGIPDDIEPTLTVAEGGPYNYLLYDTFVGDGYPDPDTIENDIERHAVLTQTPWNTNSADAEDWARPGKQWNP